MQLPVNEVFETIQGEATFTGTPAVFIRLQGCPIGCGWCDTKHTWHTREADSVPLSQVMQKDGGADTPKFARVHFKDLANLVQASFDARHVVITGGEPCLHDLEPLSSALVAAGYRVQIETSATHPIRCHADTWVTVSPKVGMPGGFPIRDDAMQRADEIKWPVGKQRDVDNLVALCGRNPGVPVWLQPLSQSPKATRLCVDAATRNGWRVSIQTHKFMGVR